MTKLSLYSYLQKLIPREYHCRAVRPYLLVIVSCLAVGVTSYAAVTDGITAYWSFDGHLNDQAHGAVGSSSQIADVGVFDGSNGTDGIGYDTGFLGTHSLFFNGGSGSAEDDGHVRVTGSDDTHFGGSDNLTISLWVKSDSLNVRWQTILAHGEQSEYRIARYQESSTAAFSAGTNIFGGANIDDGSWHHIVAINEAGISSRLYVDGSLAVTGSAFNIVDDLAQDLLIGANPEITARREWDGNIDDVAIWNRAITAAEIAEIYNNGSGKSIDDFFAENGVQNIEQGMTAYWNFDGNLLDQAEQYGTSASSVADDGAFVGANGTDGISYDTGFLGPQSIFMNGGSGVNENDGHVEVSGSDDTHFGDSDTMTLSIWFKASTFDTRWQTLIAHGEQSEYRIARYQSSNQMSCNVGSGDVPGGPDINDDAWHHLVAISESGVGTRHYIDGALAATGDAPDLIDDLGNDLYIGGNPEITSILEWSGNIDDLALWNRVLTPTEISQIYNGGAGQSIGDLVDSISEISIVSVLDTSGYEENVLVNSSSAVSTQVASLGATTNSVDTITYTLVSGTGDTDNAKYTIGGASGDELQLNTSLIGVDGVTHSIRVQAEQSGTEVEGVFSLAVVIDSDFDLLPDSFEQAKAGNLIGLTGLPTGPGPGSTTGDFDGDTFTDREEFILSLDPVMDDSDLIPGMDSIGSLAAYMDGNLPVVTPSSGAGDWGVENAFPNLTFASLIGIATEPNSTYVHALERRGSIQRFDSSDSNVSTMTEFIDISSEIVLGDNGGLRSVIFHPEYNDSSSPNRNYFYVFYTTEADLSHNFFTSGDGSFLYAFLVSPETRARG